MMTEDLILTHGNVDPHVHFESLNPLGKSIETFTFPCRADKRPIVNLRAKVIQATGATVHRHATIVEGRLVRGAQIPTSVYVEISEASAGFSLLHYYDANGSCVADT